MSLSAYAGIAIRLDAEATDLILGQPLAGTITITSAGKFDPQKLTPGEPIMWQIPQYRVLVAPGKVDNAGVPSLEAAGTYGLKPPRKLFKGGTLVVGSDALTGHAGLYRGDPLALPVNLRELSCYLFPTSGTYSVVVEIKGQRSPPLVVSVVPPQGDDEEAWQALPKREYAVFGFGVTAAPRLTGAQEPKEAYAGLDKLEEFLRKFPDSRYSRWLKPGIQKYALLCSRENADIIRVSPVLGRLVALSRRERPTGVFSSRAQAERMREEVEKMKRVAAAFRKKYLRRVVIDIARHEGARVQGTLVWSSGPPNETTFAGLGSREKALARLYANGGEARIAEQTKELPIELLATQEYTLSFVSDQGAPEAIECMTVVPTAAGQNRWSLQLPPSGSPVANPKTSPDAKRR